MNNNINEIDLGLILGIIKRNKIIILIITLLGTFGGVIYSLTATPIWKGSFEIVVRSTDKSQSSLSSGNTSNLNFVLQNQSLLTDDANKTEELILRSPSVLKPVYRYVTEYYQEKNIAREMDYKSWLKKDLNIEFENGSKVLKIEYKNADKELIIKTLDLISEKYQSYSKKGRTKNIRNTIKYLESQSEEMKVKEKISRIKLNNYTIENNLIGYLEEKNNTSSDPSERRFSIGTLDDSNFIKGFSGQFRLLNKLENQYALLSTSLKPNSKTLKQLESRIEKFKESLKRPQEIILEFRNLVKDTRKNEEILFFIENNLELAKLENFKITEPWELISDPTLDSFRFSPNRTKITLIASIISFLGTASALVVHHRSLGKLLSVNELKAKLDCTFLDNIYSSNWNISKKILQRTIENYEFKGKENTKFGIINFKNQKINQFINLKEFKFNVEEFYDINNEIIDKTDVLILLVDFLQIDTNDIALLNKYISIEKSKYMGWINFDNESTLS